MKEFFRPTKLKVAAVVAVAVYLLMSVTCSLGSVPSQVIFTDILFRTPAQMPDSRIDSHVQADLHSRLIEAACNSVIAFNPYYVIPLSPLTAIVLGINLVIILAFTYAVVCLIVSSAHRFRRWRSSPGQVTSL